LGAEAVPPAVLSPGQDLQQLRLENETLSAVVAIISSTPDLHQVLLRVVDLLTRATACHACFVYLAEDDELRLRAASPVYAHLIGRVRFGIDQGLAGWAVRNRQPGFIRDHALEDPRTIYVPELEEERFQSMVAVPIPARQGPALGAIVLHTVAPREFDEGVLAVLTRAAALVAGAIENAKLFEESTLRVQALTRWTDIAQRLAGAADRDELYRLATAGARSLLPCDHARLYALDPQDRLRVVAEDPATGDAPPEASSTRIVLDLLSSPTLDAPRLEAIGRELGMDQAPGAALAIALSAGHEQRGVLVAAAREPWRAHGAELTRALGHLLALALDKADLIEHLTAENVARDLFEALSRANAVQAANRGRAAGIDLDRPHVIVHARPFSEETDWGVAGAGAERALRGVVPGTICDLGTDELRCLVPTAEDGPAAARALLAVLSRVAEAHGVALGVSDSRRGAAAASRSLVEAVDASRLVQALHEAPAALLHRDAGAYRYLTHLLDGDAPRDHLHEAVDLLLAYDTRRQANLLATLERYLESGRAYAPTARELNIHVNTLRQRLQRAEEISGLSLDEEDLLSLQLVIKLARARRRT
jgi:GAF domain-containing protein